MNFRKVRKDCRCDCGHLKTTHFRSAGQCRACGCTWFWPNLRAVKARKKMLRRKADERNIAYRVK